MRISPIKSTPPILREKIKIHLFSWNVKYTLDTKCQRRVTTIATWDRRCSSSPNKGSIIPCTTLILFYLLCQIDGSFCNFEKHNNGQKTYQLVMLYALMSHMSHTKYYIMWYASNHGIISGCLHTVVLA